MKIGYARTSTIEQVAGIEDQIVRLKAEGCDKIFDEHASGAKQRDQFDAAIDFAREGDTLVVTKLDRAGRDLRSLLETVETLDAKGVSLRILDFGGSTIDTKGAAGKLMLQMFGALAEFERNQMLERQAVGIAKAKADGVYKGRVPTAMRQADKVKAMLADGMTRAAIATELNISERSVYRVQKEMA